MWLEELQSAGLRPEDPTLVIWEGVSMYMDRDAVEAVLASVGGSSPLVGPAALAFDFASRTMLEEDTGLVAQMAAIGEPLLFGAEPDEMAAMVEASGLEVLDLLSPLRGSGATCQCGRQTAKVLGWVAPPSSSWCQATAR